MASGEEKKIPDNEWSAPSEEQENEIKKHHSLLFFLIILHWLRWIIFRYLLENVINMNIQIL